MRASLSVPTAVNHRSIAMLSAMEVREVRRQEEREVRQAEEIQIRLAAAGALIPVLPEGQEETRRAVVELVVVVVWLNKEWVRPETRRAEVGAEEEGSILRYRQTNLHLAAVVEVQAAIRQKHTPPGI